MLMSIMTKVDFELFLRVSCPMTDSSKDTIQNFIAYIQIDVSLGRYATV